jgi:flagellar biosynthesis protein FlhG
LRPLDDQNHYEALEVPVDADQEQIERAYRVARASFSDDSMALYSVFDVGDAAAVRERLDTAYKVLSDAEGRQRYDDEIHAESPVREQGEPASASPTPHQTATSVSVIPPLEAFDEIEEDDEARDFDGARLRRARLRRGIEVEQISKVTKINPGYLQALEEESYDDLPASVYVRGFISAYAKAIGLDAAHVASTYLARMESIRPGQAPERRLDSR